MAFTFTLSSCFAGPLSEKLGKRPIIIGCNVLISVALWLCGGLKAESSAMTWLGLALNGLFVAGPIILTMPEVMDSIELSLSLKNGSVL